MQPILPTIKPAKGFKYLDEPQRTQPWIQMRSGKVTASNLYKFLAVGKRDGKPLKAHFDYLQELAYEKQFGTVFERFVTEAMKDGIEMESFMRQQYGSQCGVVVEECGSFYNDWFAASPDGLVGKDGIAEFKWLKDSSYMDILTSGIPDDYYKQVQGQLWASGRKWCDFVAGNANSSTFKVIRVLPDKEMFKTIEESKELLVLPKLDTESVFSFTNKVTWE